jgi:hypothetical protein
MSESELVSKVLKGNAEAILFFKTLAHCSQQMDDLVDEDKLLNRYEQQHLFWNLLVALPSNTFYKHHQDSLLPVMMMVLNDWFVANEIEERSRGSQDVSRLHVAYVLRDSLGMLLCQMALIIGGCDWMNEVSVEIRLYLHDELFTDYLESL